LPVKKIIAITVKVQNNPLFLTSLWIKEAKATHSQPILRVFPDIEIKGR
jgi:hypothetical protein